MLLYILSGRNPFNIFFFVEDVSCILKIMSFLMNYRKNFVLFKNSLFFREIFALFFFVKFLLNSFFILRNFREQTKCENFRKNIFSFSLKTLDQGVKAM